MTFIGQKMIHSRKLLSMRRFISSCLRSSISSSRHDCIIYHTLSRLNRKEVDISYLRRTSTCSVRNYSSNTSTSGSFNAAVDNDSDDDDDSDSDDDSDDDDSDDDSDSDDDDNHDHDDVSSAIKADTNAAEIAEESGPDPTVGFDVVLNRVANILINLTERKASKILHIYPESNLCYYLRTYSCFHVLGLSTAAENNRDFKYKKVYGHISYINASPTDSELAYQQACHESIDQQPSSAYHCVVFVAPPPSSSSASSLSSSSSASLSSSATSSTTMPLLHVDLKELINMVTYQGFLIIGSKTEDFNKDDMYNRLMALDQSNEWGHFMSLQEISYESSDSVSVDNYRDNSGSVENDKDKHNSSSSGSSSRSSTGTGTDTVGTDKINYMLAVFKRL